MDFDKKSIKSLHLTCKERIPAVTEDIANSVAAELEIVVANISSISICRLIVVSNVAKYYASAGRLTISINTHYTNVLSDFKLKEAYMGIKEEEGSKAPSINQSR